ncbi:MAG: glycosyltransferase family 4 protein [Deltaproteobacteria bacterium]|nr:glycosyltransferase family 4 protein [Deltaproteobacteria bacterium]
MRIGYLVTEYPAVSHTFIRREIHALEAMGVDVVRYTVRRQRSGPLKDPLDLAEADKTRVILEVGARGLALASSRVGARDPARFAKVAQHASAMGARSERGLAYHGAYLAEACVLREWMEADGVEHLHAHFGTNSAMVALLAHELGGPSFSFTCHGPDEFDKPQLIHLGDKVRGASMVAAVSSFGRSQLYRWARKQDWSKIDVVRCGVDDAYLTHVATPVPSTPRVVSVGRLSEQKGQILLVRAVAALVKRGIAIELVLVGDGPMRADIEQVIADEGIAGSVRITGYVSGDSVKREILEARAFVLPSFAEGLPVAIMEALALARPVVSTYVAGIPELVVPGRTGWLVPAGSIEALVPAIEAVLATDPERLTAMGRNGQAAVRAQHDVRVSAAQLRDHFAKAIASGAR